MSKKKRVLRGLLDDFKKFVSRGNILDLAVAVIIGAAFGKIVSSLVNDIITPFFSLIIGRTDISGLKWVIIEAAEATEGSPAIAEVAVAYGIFLKSIIDFLLIAVSVFFVIRIYTKAKDKIQKEAREADIVGKVRGLFDKDEPVEVKADEAVLKVEESIESDVKELITLKDEDLGVSVKIEKTLEEIKELLKAHLTGS